MAISNFISSPMVLTAPEPGRRWPAETVARCGWQGLLLPSERLGHSIQRTCLQSEQHRPTHGALSPPVFPFPSHSCGRATINNEKALFWAHKLSDFLIQDAFFSLALQSSCGLVGKPLYGLPFCYHRKQRKSLGPIPPDRRFYSSE